MALDTDFALEKAAEYQSISYNGRTKTLQNLTELRALDLAKKVEAERKAAGMCIMACTADFSDYST